MADMTTANDSAEQSDKATTSQSEGDTTTTQPDVTTTQPDAATNQANSIPATPEAEDAHVSWSTLMAVLVSGMKFM